jgi:hypothetical protein
MLRGSLNDLAIADLVQIPLGNRKTGELLIATEEQDARLYYVDGSLVHLVSGEDEGAEVLDRIVGWTEGEFEFRPDVIVDDVDTEEDLNPALRVAVMRITRKNTRKKKPLTPPAERVAARVRRLLHEFLSNNDFAIHACLMYCNGTMDVCGVERTDTPGWLEELRTSVLDVVASYPRKQLNRMLLEDEDGTLVVTCYPEDHSALLVAAKRGATLGAVSISVDRLARRIAEVRGE